jgi:hypothetical protein
VIRKPKPLRSNPTRYILLRLENNDLGYFIDDEAILASHRRPEIELKKDTVDDDEELSDYVKTRLWLARHLALMKASGYDLKARV